MSQENVDAVRETIDAWNRGDADGWLKWAHPDIEWTSEVRARLEGVEAPVRGLEEMRHYWDEFHSVWKLTIDITEWRDLGDTVVAIGRFRTHGEASGIDLEHEVAYVAEFEGRLARRMRAYFDPRQALEAAGAPD